MHANVIEPENITLYVPAIGDTDISPQEEIDTNTLVGLMSRVFPDIYSKFRILSVFKEPKVPDIFPALQVERFFNQPMGLKGCVDYLIETFGREKEAQQYLASVQQQA
ncbi:hypothetical protein KY338_03320 [Candidatus Woesearchaeota archaeon]|nr:hypothetical protein [Candidatus Woesearchaeota archaeon]MBW3005367.1 hypothetical protein [Candidatus Woesearchaeota archaeon]